MLDRRDVRSPADVASYVNAALGGAVVASLGGYSHARYWSSVVADLGLGFMSTTPLEFVAYGIEVILASGGAGDGAHVAIYTSSLSSAGILCGKSPSALLMLVIHSEVAALPEFRALVPTLVTGYCFGVGNPRADPASVRPLHRPRDALRSARRRATAHRPEPRRAQLRRSRATALPHGALVWAHHRARPDAVLPVNTAASALCSLLSPPRRRCRHGARYKYLVKFGYESKIETFCEEVLRGLILGFAFLVASKESESMRRIGEMLNSPVAACSVALGAVLVVREIISRYSRYRCSGAVVMSAEAVGSRGSAR